MNYGMHDAHSSKRKRPNSDQIPIPVQMPILSPVPSSPRDVPSAAGDSKKRERFTGMADTSRTASRIAPVSISTNPSADTDADKSPGRKKKNQTFEQRIEDLKKFKEKYGHCDVRRRFKTHNSLATWSRDIRYAYRGNGNMNLTEDRMRRLEEIGFKWVLPQLINTMHSVNSSPSILISTEQDAEIKWNSQGDDKIVSSGSPGSPAFDPSRYTHKELIDWMEESKKVCIEMERRETIRLNEIASRLFESDDDDESSNGKSSGEEYSHDDDDSSNGNSIGNTIYSDDEEEYNHGDDESNGNSSGNSIDSDDEKEYSHDDDESN